VVMIKLKRKTKKGSSRGRRGRVWRVLSLHIGDGKRDPSEAEGRSFLCFILPGLLNAMIAHGSGHQKKRRKNSNVALFFKPPKKRTKEQAEKGDNKNGLGVLAEHLFAGTTRPGRTLHDAFFFQRTKKGRRVLENGRAKCKRNPATSTTTCIYPFFFFFFFFSPEPP